MKIEIKKIEPIEAEKNIEAGEELGNGVYHAKFWGKDRIIIICEDRVLAIDDLGGVQLPSVAALADTYTNIKKIKSLKIEYEVEA